jgi:hypothetical protein
MTRELTLIIIPQIQMKRDELINVSALFKQPRVLTTVNTFAKLKAYRNASAIALP